MDQSIDPVSLLKQLVAIPSYVDAGNNEVALADFLAAFFRRYTPQLTVAKQSIGRSGRCNLLVTGSRNPKLFVLGHIDTVQPKASWATDPLKPVSRGGRLYGLGAADMKGSLAAWLAALVAQKDALQLDDLAMLWYADEEYDFKGMKRFVRDLSSWTMRPELILSLDGDLELSSGCRGLIEITMAVNGKSGHAGNPANGVNAITETAVLFEELRAFLGTFRDVYLGPSTLNVAYLRGGTVQKQAGETAWQREGNVIPDCADITFEVRPSCKEVDVPLVLDKMTELARKRGLAIASTSVRHDIAPWPVSYDSPQVATLRQLYKQAAVPFRKADRAHSGYIDAQMVADKIDASAFIIGAGGGNKHSADEYVPLANVRKAQKLYEGILRQYAGGRNA